MYEHMILAVPALTASICNQIFISGVWLRMLTLEGPEIELVHCLIIHVGRDRFDLRAGPRLRISVRFLLVSNEMLPRVSGMLGIHDIWPYLGCCRNTVILKAFDCRLN